MKYIYIIITGIITSIFIFNFLDPEEKPEINDIKHEKSFQDKIDSYSIGRVDSLDFAGEYTPLFADDIWERYDKEIHKNVYWQSNTLFYIKRANKYFPIIEPILKENNIPEDFKYLAIAESGLENVVSPAGASGFWQFLSATAKEYNLEVNSEIDERYHLKKSTQAACEYIQKAYDEFGSWTTAAASYNCGINGMRSRIKKQNSKNYYNIYLPQETSRYIFRIIAIKEILEHPVKYGFQYREKDLYKFPETKEIKISESNIDLYNYAQDIGLNYKILKHYNPWLRSDKITNKKNNTYILDVPVRSEKIIFN